MIPIIYKMTAYIWIYKYCASVDQKVIIGNTIMTLHMPTSEEAILLLEAVIIALIR